MNTIAPANQQFHSEHAQVLDVMMIVDQDLLNRDILAASSSVDLAQQAGKLRSLVNIFGLHASCLALVSENDLHTSKIFSEQGFKTIAVNGNRPKVLQELTGVLGRQVERGEIRQIILVTRDASFQPFCAQAASHVRITIWLPGEQIPPELENASFNPRLLSEIIPAEKKGKVDVRFDFENLLFGLESMGFKPTPTELNRWVRSTLSDLGSITSITAYADWRVIREHTQIDFQDEFELLGVRTRYQKSLRGKNSADMEIANDIRSIVEKDSPDSPDVIVLASHDRDFRPSLETARKRGKKIVLLVLPTGLSQELRLVADEIRYLVPDSALSAGDSLGDLPKITPWDECAKLVATIDRDLSQRNWSWIYQSRIASLFGYDEDPKIVQKAIKDGILIPASLHQNALELNREHPFVKGFLFLRDWTMEKIRHALKNPYFSYVDTNYLFRGIAMDRRFKNLGIGVSRPEVSGWLDLLSQSGWLTKQIKPHPKEPQKQITTWQLKDSY